MPIVRCNYWEPKFEFLKAKEREYSDSVQTFAAGVMLNPSFIR